MTTASELPLISTPQQLAVSLSGTVYNLRMSWCKPAQCWILDVSDANGVPVLQGVPLVTGTNLLGQYAYLGIPGKLVVLTDSDPDAVPTFTDLGSQGHVYYVTTP